MIKAVKKIGKTLQRCFKSKFVVGLAILGLWGVGSIANTASAEEEPYVFGATYQIYMLGTKAEEIQDGTKTQKVAKLGNLGSGGVSGEFSYDDIVNSSKSEENKETAKSFASMMATYSTFGYISNKVQAFESIRHDIIRGILGVLLFIPAILVDVLNMLIPQLVGLVAKYNVITFLGKAFGNTSMASGIAEATGLTTEKITTFTNVIISFAVIVIILNIFGVFKSGGRNVDKRQVSKLKGRLVTLIALPLFVVAGANILDFTSQLTGADDALEAGKFSNYLVDVRSWAYNFNFAPQGDSAEASDISPSRDSSYVDLDFNPYTEAGKERIQHINSKSSLIGTNQVFANSSLVLSYMKGQSFSALDYINYKGTKASQHYYNGVEDGSGGTTFGSYYAYANKMKDQLVSDTPMTGSGNKDAVEKGDEKGSYQSAIDDYSVKTDKTDKVITVSPQVAWRDRYIYGAKNSGKNMDKYYNDTPSQEMIKTTVGATDEGTALTDQSMFLVLSTIFTETGGKYSIDAPARGIMQAKAKFDSNRSDYYVVSMVGNPIFTVAGLIAEPLILLVAFIALVFAVLGIGFLDMNILPLRAWVKGLTLGDIEYPEAFMVYALGIAGTIAGMFTIPQLFVKVMTFASKAFTLPASITGFEPTTPMSSLTVQGLPLIVSAGIAIVIVAFCIKRPEFFEKIVGLYTFIWSWAKEQGRLLERNAMSQGMKMGERGRVGNQEESMSAIRSFRNRMSKGSGNGNNPKSYGDPDDPSTPSNELGNHQTSANDDGDVNSISKINKAGNPLNETDAELEGVALDSENSEAVQDYANSARDGLKKFKEEPTEANLKDVRQRLGDLKQQMVEEGSDPEDVEKIDRALNNVDSVAKDYEVETPDSNEQLSDPDGLELNEEEANRDIKVSDNLTEMEAVKPIDALNEKDIPDSEQERNVNVSDNLAEVNEGMNPENQPLEDVEKERDVKASENVIDSEETQTIGDPELADAEANRNVKASDNVTDSEEAQTIGDPELADAEAKRNVKASDNVMDSEEAQTIADPKLADVEAKRNIKASNNVVDSQEAQTIGDPKLADVEAKRNVKASDHVHGSNEARSINEPIVQDANVDRQVNIKDRVGNEDRSLIRDSNNLKDQRRTIEKTIDNVDEKHLNEKTINRTTENSLNRNNRNEKTLNRMTETNKSKNIYVENENYERLFNSLGKATSNSSIGKALSEVKTSQNDKDLRKALLKLSKSYVSLDSSYKKGVNDKNVLKTIGNMVKYNSESEK